MILILAVGRSQVRVLRNGKTLGTFNSSDVDRFVVFGQAGNDTIIVNGNLSIPTTLFGEAGNDNLSGGKRDDEIDGGSGNDRVFGFNGSDHLVGGEGNDYLFGGTGNDFLFGQGGNDWIFGDAGNDVVVGGSGKDSLYGGSGRDLLIGGDGSDSLFGEAHDDILVAGSTVHDADLTALAAILAEWTSTNSYATRVANIRNGGGANDAFTLDDTTVIDDGAVDTLWGQSGQDWFLFGSGDKLRDKAENESVN